MNVQDTKGATGDESQTFPNNMVNNPQISPAPEHPKLTAICRSDQTPVWKIVLEAAAVVIGAAALAIYGGQLWVMKGQLTEMKESGKQTDQLISLYGQQLVQLQNRLPTPATCL
jgi:hypothetical protein